MAASNEPSMLEIIRLRVSQSGLKQCQIADAIGIQRSGLNAFLAGRQGMRLTLFERLVTVLGLTLEPTHEMQWSSENHQIRSRIQLPEITFCHDKEQRK